MESISDCRIHPDTFEIFLPNYFSPKLLDHRVHCSDALHRQTLHRGRRRDMGIANGINDCKLNATM